MIGSQELALGQLDIAGNEPGQYLSVNYEGDAKLLCWILLTYWLEQLE